MPLTSSKPLLNQQIHSKIHLNPEQIDSSASPDGERKTVTAQFADIKGSMEFWKTSTWKRRVPLSIRRSS